jgi:hypothetical protein
VKTLEALVGAQQKNRTGGLSESFMRGRHPVRIYLLPERPAKRFSRSQDPFLPFSGLFCCDAQRSFAGEARRNRDNISAVDKPPPEQPPSRSPEEQAILVIAGLWRAIPFI